MKKGFVSFLVITTFFLSFLLSNAQTIPAKGATKPEILPKTVYTIVDKMPKFPGGETALQKFIDSIKVLPRIDHENGIEGTIDVHFIIDTSGKVMGVNAIQPFDKFLAREAVRVVKLLPKWKPGIKNGKHVATYYSVSVEFVDHNPISADMRQKELERPDCMLKAGR